MITSNMKCNYEAVLPAQTCLEPVVMNCCGVHKVYMKAKINIILTLSGDLQK